MSHPRAEQEEIRQLVPEQLSPQERLLCAEMIFSALPQFYQLFPVPRPEMLNAIAAQIGQQGTELELCHALRAGDKLRAVIAAVPACRLAAAKKSGLLALMRKVPRTEARGTLDVMGKFEALVEPAPETGLYLSRLGAAHDPQAVGAGTRLLRGFLGRSAETCFSLHVHCRNPARWLYRKLGFQPSQAQSREFWCMILDRTAASSSDYDRRHR